jgi:hypothetical protein
MSTEQPAILMGHFAFFKVNQTRGTAQIIVEVPSSRANEVLATLGGFPDPEKPKPVSVGLFDPKKVSVAASKVIEALQSTEEQPFADPDPTPPQDKPAKKHREPVVFAALPRASQAAIRCQEPPFWRFLEERSSVFWGQRQTVTTKAAADFVLKELLGIQSKKELDESVTCSEAWDKIEDDFQKQRLGYR